MSDTPHSSFTHNNNFDFIRFAAAVMVWYYHCYALTGGHDPLTRLLPFQSFGSLGVSIFFVISGYFVTASYQRHRKLVPFLRNRALRILPALIVMVLLAAFLLGPLVTTLSLTGYMHDAQTWHYLKNMLVFPLRYELPGVFASNEVHAVNIPLWTLPHEVRCYVAIALLGLLGIPAAARRDSYIPCACRLPYLWRAYGQSPDGHVPRPTRRQDSHSGASGFPVRGRRGDLYAQGLGAASFRFLTACFLLMVLSTRLSEAWGSMLFDLALMYSVIYLGFLRVPLLWNFSRFGDFSYGMYLYAFPVQQLTLHFLKGVENFTLFMLVSFAGALLCAIASWHVVEKPALRHKV